MSPRANHQAKPRSRPKLALARREIFPALDGLRGLAIVAAVIHFASASRFAWPAAELFFALSGFLTTRSLRQDGDVFAFYRRRARRWLPGYYAAVGALALTGTLLPKQIPVYLCFLQNWWQFAQGEWAPRAAAPLCWLAILVQLELSWPWVLKVGSRHLKWFCLGGAVASALLRHWLYLRGMEPVSIIAATPSHLDAWLIGAALALLSAKERRFFTHASLQLALPACGAWVAYVLTGNPPDVFGWDFGIFATALLSGALISLALASAFLLAWEPLRWLGRHSFSIYLIYPLIFLAALKSFHLAIAWPLLLGVSALTAWPLARRAGV